MQSGIFFFLIAFVIVILCHLESIFVIFRSCQGVIEVESPKVIQVVFEVTVGFLDMVQVVTADEQGLEHLCNVERRAPVSL